MQNGNSLVLEVSCYLAASARRITLVTISMIEQGWMIQRRYLSPSPCAVASFIVHCTFAQKFYLVA